MQGLLALNAGSAITLLTGMILTVVIVTIKPYFGRPQPQEIISIMKLLTYAIINCER